MRTKNQGFNFGLWGTPCLTLISNLLAKKSLFSSSIFSPHLPSTLFIHDFSHPTSAVYFSCLLLLVLQISLLYFQLPSLPSSAHFHTHFLPTLISLNKPLNMSQRLYLIYLFGIFQWYALSFPANSITLSPVLYWNLIPCCFSSQSPTI